MGTVPAMARFSSSTPTPDRAVLAALRVLAALLGTLFVLAGLLYSGYVGYTSLDGPSVAVEPSALQVDTSRRRITAGRSWLGRSGRLWELHLTGSPEEIGSSHGQLTGRLFHDLRQRIDGVLAARYPGLTDAWAANLLMRWNYRGADARLAGSAATELGALAAMLPEAQSAGYGAYHVLFLHQCFLELAARLDDVVAEGLVFAARATRGGRAEGNLLVGRTFSIDLGNDFELDRLITFYHPDGKYPFVSVGWAGFTGVVTGVNARGIFVALNPARTDDPMEEGTPAPLVARKVLEEADSLESAVAILRAAPLRTANIILVADGAARTSAVVELSARDQDDHRVVRGVDDPSVIATDHFLSDAFAADPHNDRLRRDTPSGRRFDRLAELLRATPPASPEGVVTILRDRSGPAGADLGLGNRNALDHLATTHSVVVDATAMVLWVAEGPSNLGRYQAFDLRHLLGREGRTPTAIMDLAADPSLYGTELEDYREGLRSLAYARAELAAGRLPRALWAATVGAGLAPDLGDLHRLLGDIHRELGDAAAARASYERYLELAPGRLRDQERVRGILAELPP
jgi:hypothetical protein